MGKLESQNNFEGINSFNNFKKADISEVKKVQDDISNALNFQEKEKISNILDEVGIEEKDQEKLINKILNFKNNKNFENILNRILDSFDEKDIINILKEEEVDIKKEEVDIKKEEVDIKKEEVDIKKEKEIQDVKNILLNLRGKNSRYYKGLISKLEENNFDGVIKELKNNPQTLRAVISDLKEQGGNALRNFRNSIGEIDNELGEKIDLIDFTDSRAKISLGSDSLDGVDLGKDVLKKETGDGFDVSAGRDGRKLSLQGSKYEMDAGLKNSDEINKFVEVEKNTKEELKPINEKLSSIRAILNFVKKAISKNADLGEVKEKIRNSNKELYNELSIDGASNLGDIESKLAGIYKQKQDEKDKILEEKKKILDEIVEFNMQKALDRDEKQKEVLKFLNSIGFDKLPQEATNRIIDLVNKTNMKGSLGFNENIDLSNGELGLNRDGDNSVITPEEEKQFAKFTNMLISGDEKRPINLSTIGTMSVTFRGDEIDPETGEYERMDSLDLSGYVNRKMGTNAYSSMINNLNKYYGGKTSKELDENKIRAEEYKN